ncbi:cobalamin biosynthesis protein [Streptomyces genisteinicus]|uniref:Cobalamin biosynthesis protein n=1 Tax=Streptomyces genisteinicus TaxID=2768068 RepID=A0A7H0HQ63_9ACTN|nr:cobalamin biosynthesis protein [Streptomyces genisteinicus]
MTSPAGAGGPRTGEGGTGSGAGGAGTAGTETGTGGRSGGEAGGPRGGIVVGVGASRGVPADEVVDLVLATLRDAGLRTDEVTGLATLDRRASEPGIVAAAARLGVPVTAYPAGRLAAVAVPGGSASVLAAVGTPSVAEAAALAGGGDLLVPKRTSRPEGRPAGVTCAIAREGGGRPGASAGTGRQKG